MKNISRYAIVFMIILFLKTSANPIMVFFINEFVPDSSNFSMEILTSGISSLDGWYLTSLTDTAYLNDGLSVDGEFIVIIQDSLKSHFSLNLGVINAF